MFKTPMRKDVQGGRGDIRYEVIKDNFIKLFWLCRKSKGFFFSSRIKIFIISLSAVDHPSHFFIVFSHFQMTQTF